jgi:hypothetical protein
MTKEIEKMVDKVVCPKRDMCTEESYDDANNHTHCRPHKHNKNCGEEIGCSLKDSECVQFNADYHLVTPTPQDKAEAGEKELRRRIRPLITTCTHVDKEQCPFGNPVCGECEARLDKILALISPSIELPVLTCERLTELLKEMLTPDEFISLSSFPNQFVIGKALTHGIVAQRDADQKAGGK